MFNRNRNQKENKYVEEIEANDISSLDPSKIKLGKQLVTAFHDKQNPSRIRQLIALGAPVNYRLDYGLEVKFESDFVAQFFLMLEGDISEEKLLENAIKLVAETDKAIQLANYVKTGLEIFNILYANDANNEIVKVNSKFLQYLLDYAIHCRGNPDHANGSLILAAGIRNVDFVSKILYLGKYIDNLLHDPQNGAGVNFKGYFGDNAAVWSAILLDKNTLNLLLDNGSEIHDIGVTKSSLLHWVVLADRLENKPARQKMAFEMAVMLLAKGARLDALNAIGKTPIDYARNELKEFLLSHKKLTMKI